MAFPAHIGCGRAKGVWAAYRTELESFAKGHARWRILVYDFSPATPSEDLAKPFLGADWWQGIEIAPCSVTGGVLAVRTGKRSDTALAWKGRHFVVDAVPWEVMAQAP